MSDDFNGRDDDGEEFPPSKDFKSTDEDSQEFLLSKDFKSTNDNSEKICTSEDGNEYFLRKDGDEFSDYREDKEMVETLQENFVSRPVGLDLFISM